MPWISHGYRIVDAVDPSRETLARHLANAGQMAFPFACACVEGADGHWDLQPKDPSHWPAGKAMARMSTLCSVGEDVARRLSKCAGLTYEETLALATPSKGECFAHIDGNDTGAGNRVHGHVPWGSRSVDACPGLSYIFGDEGLPPPSEPGHEAQIGPRRHVGEDLWHVVMVISFRCTERECQAVLGWEEGDATCMFQFPMEDPNMPGDELRVHVYGVDYSRWPHGNPMKCVAMPANGWVIRFTPYGTTHMATWAGIVRHISESGGAVGRQRAKRLLESLVEDGGGKKLGTAAHICEGHVEIARHPERQHPGRDAPMQASELREGQFAKLRSLDGEFLHEGLVLCMHGTVYVGREVYQPAKHVVTVVKPGKRTRSQVSM